MFDLNSLIKPQASALSPEDKYAAQLVNFLLSDITSPNSVQAQFKMTEDTFSALAASPVLSTSLVVKKLDGVIEIMRTTLENVTEMVNLSDKPICISHITTLNSLLEFVKSKFAIVVQQATMHRCVTAGIRLNFVKSNPRLPYRSVLIIEFYGFRDSDDDNAILYQRLEPWLFSAQFSK